MFAHVLELMLLFELEDSLAKRKQTGILLVALNYAQTCNGVANNIQMNASNMACNHANKLYCNDTMLPCLFSDIFSVGTDNVQLCTIISKMKAYI